MDILSSFLGELLAAATILIIGVLFNKFLLPKWPRLRRAIFIYKYRIFGMVSYAILLWSLYLYSMKIEILVYSLVITGLAIFLLWLWTVNTSQINQMKRSQANIKVWADREDGVPTGLYLIKGENVRILASGQISYDYGNTFFDPDGNMISKDGEIQAGKFSIVGGKTLLLGQQKAGMLVGWIGKYNPMTAFEIGSQKEFKVQQNGELVLAVNDARGAYLDNVDSSGEPTYFNASIHVSRLSE